MVKKSQQKVVLINTKFGIASGMDLTWSWAPMHRAMLKSRWK